MEFLESALLTVAGAATESAAVTIPTVPDEGLVCMIWKVDFTGAITAPVSVAGGAEFTLSKTEGVVLPSSPAVLCAGRMDYSALNAVTRPGVLDSQGLQHRFDPPIAVARPTLYVVLKVASALTSGHLYCKIGYTIEKVPQNVLLRALIE